MKTRTFLILATLVVLAGVVAVALLLTSSPLWSRDLALEAKQGLPQGTAILVRTAAGEQGAHVGDVFSYRLEALYDPAEIAEIDAAGLDKNVDLKPFEIREVRDRDYRLDKGTRVFQREYQIQLITGETGQLYQFPTIVVRYRLADSDGLSNTSISPEPVFIAPRLPAEVPDLDYGYGPLRPIAEKVQGVNLALPWILWSLGGLLAALGAADLARRAIPQWVENGLLKRRGEGVDLVQEAFRSVSDNLAAGARPDRLLHQMDHLLRTVLARKEGMDWLEELDPDSLSPETREPARSLLERCQKAYRADAAGPADAAEALRQLEQILAFYFGAAEVEAWRS